MHLNLVVPGNLPCKATWEAFERKSMSSGIVDSDIMIRGKATDGIWLYFSHRNVIVSGLMVVFVEGKIVVERYYLRSYKYNYWLFKCITQLISYCRKLPLDDTIIVNCDEAKIPLFKEITMLLCNRGFYLVANNEGIHTYCYVIEKNVQKIPLTYTITELNHKIYKSTSRMTTPREKMRILRLMKS